MSLLFNTVVAVVVFTLLFFGFTIVRSLFFKGSGSSSKNRGGARHKKGQNNTVLLLGLQHAGKTSFFYKLRDGKVRPTHTSLESNESTFIPRLGLGLGVLPNPNADGQTQTQPQQPKPKRPVHVVDLPGHERNLAKLRTQLLPHTAAILYFVDSMDFASSMVDNAEFLYDLLTSAHVVERQVPICVLCNKHDIALFKKEYIKKQLENELDKMRRTRVNQLESLDDEHSRDVVELVLDEKQPFSFDKTAQTEVRFVDCSVTKGEGLDAVMQFIAQHTTAK